MSRTQRLGAAALATILCLSTSVAVSSRPKDRPFRATRHWEGQSVAEGDYFAWQQISRGSPNRADLFLRKPSGKVVKLNRPGTQGTLGAIDGDSLVFQEFRGQPAVFGGNGSSRIVLYDLKTGKKTLPPVANGSEWEYWPTIRGPWIFFAQLDHFGSRHVIGYHRPSGAVTRADSYVSYLQPGQINAGLFAWVRQEPGAGPASVRVLDLESSSYDELRSRRWQWAPSVGPQGAVYVVETGKKCGSSPVIKRYPPALEGGIDPVGKEILRLPEGFDSSSSYAFTNPQGHTTVLHQRLKCGTKWGSDVYRFTDTVGLTVTKDGSGSGSVTGVDVAIDCGDDCAEVVSGGTWVTLDADAELGSHFAGWSEQCAVSNEDEDTCTIRLDDALTINATFDLGP